MYWKDLRTTLKRTIAPTAEPVTVTSLKTHARLSSSDEEDDLLAEYLIAAREMVEQDTERALCTQTWTLKFDQFPCDLIEIRRCPLVSVSSIVYIDTNGQSQTWASSNYIVNTGSNPGRITLAYNCTWPIARCQENAITVTFVAGFGGPADVPQIFKQAIRLLAAESVISREAVGSLTDEHLTNYRAWISRGMWSAYR